MSDDTDYFTPILAVKFNGPTAPMYLTAGAAGCDIFSAEDTWVGIEPRVVSTGLILDIPHGFEAQVRSRSGLAINHGVFVLNSPGTIDSDYRGEVKVILANVSKEPFIIKKGDRIAQLVFSRIIQATFVSSQELSQTERGDGGLGSTGI